MLIDTHAHLYLDDFAGDRADIAARCREADVTKVVLPNIDTASMSSLAELCHGVPDLYYPALGLHPCSVKEDWEAELAAIEAVIQNGLQEFPHRRIWGIGEIGLDYYWDTTFKEEQLKALRIQAGWAKRRNLPVILHSRDSFDDLIAVMEEENSEALSGIFHCFGGSLEEADRIIALGGFLIGLGGVLTFKKSEELRAVAKQVPLEYIVLETDAPYLTPAPFRGKRNESSYVRYVAQTLAEVKGLTADEIAVQTTANAIRLFGF